MKKKIIFFLIIMFLARNLFAGNKVALVDFEIRKGVIMTKNALDKLGVEYDLYTRDSFDRISLSSYNLLIFGESLSRSFLNKYSEELGRFLKEGGNILCLRADNQDLWLPSSLSFQKDTTVTHAGALIIAPDHPLLNEPHCFTRNFLDSPTEISFYFL